MIYTMSATVFFDQATNPWSSRCTHSLDRLGNEDKAITSGHVVNDFPRSRLYQHSCFEVECPQDASHLDKKLLC